MSQEIAEDLVVADQLVPFQQQVALVHQVKATQAEQGLDHQQLLQTAQVAVAVVLVVQVQTLAKE